MTVTTTQRKHSAIPPARQVAIDVLYAVIAQRMDLQSALDRELRRTPLEAKDRALATELAYGTARQYLRLSQEVRQYMKDPSAVPPILRLAMNIALYEMWFLDKVPVYASIHWAVEFAKSPFGKGFAKMVNAILRRLDRVGPSYAPEAAGPNEDDETLAVRYALPAWILRLWIEQYGRETALALAAEQLSPPATGVRVNRLRSGADELYDDIGRLSGSDSTGIAFACAFPAGSHPHLQEEHAAGRVSYQSVAVQRLLEELAPSEWPDPVLDICAGHGGKTCNLLERGKRVYASDLSMPRLRGLRHDLRRLGLVTHAVVRAAGEAAYPYRETAGTILLDVPCTGLGVLNRRPDIKLHRKPEDIEALLRLQRALLRSACQQLPAGRELLYMTCTINRDENERMVRSLLEHDARLVQTEEHDVASSGRYGERLYCCRLRKR